MRGRPTTGGGTPGTWVVCALVVALLIGYVAAAVRLLPRGHMYVHAAEVVELATYPVLLVAATLLYVYFRLSSESGAAWLAAAGVFGSLQGAGYAAIRAVEEDQVRARPVWLLVSHVLVAAVLCLMLAMIDRIPVPVDPIVLGLALALVTTVARLVLVLGAEPPEWLVALGPALVVALLLAYGALAALVARRVRIPRWAARRLAFALVTLGLAAVLAFPLPHEDWRSLVVIALDVIGAAVLALTSLNMVRVALARAALAEAELQRLEEYVRDDRTLLHEVASTMAGISVATQLLSVPTGLADDERLRLEQLLVSETARVEGLLHASENPDGDLVDVDLDALIDPLLFAHGIRGRVVAWHPTGDHVLARYDHLHEVLDVLLDNAARHARSAILALTVTRRGDQVELAVVDKGPGIPPEIASSVLEWGTHGADSTGQGIGLNVAQRLVTGMGGRLQIESGDVGTRVVVTLQAVLERTPHEVA